MFLVFSKHTFKINKNNLIVFSKHIIKIIKNNLYLIVKSKKFQFRILNQKVRILKLLRKENIRKKINNSYKAIKKLIQTYKYKIKIVINKNRFNNFRKMINK